MERIHLMLYGQMLHAKKLVFKHPRTNKTLIFEAPLPEYFQDILDGLNKNI